jgi:restriction system protein
MAKKRKAVGQVPSYDKLMIPVLNALIALGGSGSIDEVNEKVYEMENFSDATLQILHKEDGSQSEIDYRLAWARTYLKKFELLENSARGVWNLTKSNIDTKEINTDEIVRFGKSNGKSNRKSQDELSNIEIEKEVEEILEWKEQLLNTVLKISPSAFERLTQRLLRESGFVEVEVTGRSNAFHQPNLRQNDNFAAKKKSSAENANAHIPRPTFPFQAKAKREIRQTFQA